MLARANNAFAELNTSGLLAFAASVMAYLAALRMGGIFMLPEQPVSLLWPASGAALAAVWLFGKPAVAGTLAGAVLGGLLTGFPLLGALVLGLGVATAAYVGARLLRRCSFQTPLTRLRDVVSLLGAGILTTATLSSLSLAATAYFGGMDKANAFGELWWLCWIAEVVGGLVLVPVLFGWSGPASDIRSGHPLEACLVLVVAATTGWVVYSDVLPAGVAMARPLSYLIFPVMIWAAVRTTVRATALILLIHAAIAAGLTIGGHGPFAVSTVQESLLALHAHIAMLSVSSLILAAIMTERRAVTAALAESEAKYRLLVENQTDLVVKTDTDNRIVFASPTVAALFGASTDTFLGRPFQAIVNDADRNAPDSPWGGPYLAARVPVIWNARPKPALVSAGWVGRPRRCMMTMVGSAALSPLAAT